MLFKRHITDWSDISKISLTSLQIANEQERKEKDLSSTSQYVIKQKEVWERELWDKINLLKVKDKYWTKEILTTDKKNVKETLQNYLENGQLVCPFVQTLYWRCK